MSDTPDRRDDHTIPISRDEMVSHIFIALAVIKPPIQIGRGKQSLDQVERDRNLAAELLVKHMEMSGIRWFRRPPAPPHSTPGPRLDGQKR